MARQVHISPGTAHDLEQRLVWYPRYRRPVSGGRAKTRPENLASYVANPLNGLTSNYLGVEFPHLRSQPPMLWSRCYSEATVRAVSVWTVQRYIEVQDERATKGSGRA